MKRLLSLCAVLALPAVAVAENRVKVEYTYVTLDPPGAILTQANAINNQGEVVGYYSTYDGHKLADHGFLWSAGMYTTIDGPHSTRTWANGINDLGQLVGWYDDAVGRHGFLLDKDGFTTLDLPGADNTEAYGINNKGQIVGDYDMNPIGVVQMGFLLDGLTYTPIDPPGATGGRPASAINDAGEIVGRYYSSYDDSIHGYMLSDGIFAPIGVPQANNVIPFGINNHSQVVGYALVNGQDDLSFLFKDNQVTDLPFLFAFGVNDLVQIVGRIHTTGRGFLATPMVDTIRP